MKMWQLVTLKQVAEQNSWLPMWLVRRFVLQGRLDS